jgi:hypothetical protein
MGHVTYEFLSSIGGGTNFLFLLREIESSSVWVGKIFRNSKSFLKGCADLNHRELLAERLAAEVGTCLPEMRLIDFPRIGFSPEFDRMLDTVSDMIIQDDLLITRFAGLSLHNYLKTSHAPRIRNLDDILRNFVFNLWFGNYDKKTDDYVVDNDLVCRSVDYSLSGPGFDPDDRLSIGAYFQSYDFARPWDCGWAISDPFLEVIRERRLGPDFFLPMVERIESLTDATLRAAFEGLSFYRYGAAERIDEVYFRFLLDRQAGIREAVRLWCGEGWPKGIRIPEE